MNDVVAGHRNWAQLLIIGGVLAPAVAVAGLTASWVWHRTASPAPASAGDCRVAQTLLDQAQSTPHDEARAERWNRRIHQARTGRITDAGLSEQVGRYASWELARATGTGAGPKAGEFQSMKRAAAERCSDSGVDLTISTI